ncbi:hypothetical protein ME1_00712 [Bartonella vinsonii subsp. arupensis OK-94-513]|uniref:Uncharacterized protein n=2 Tax=Bartonella vinsonii subsp. arupensis TaxID=110578 RepID=J0QYH1_BARVI|nr:hypothetical protein ME1_00712 [Bartonella vinsonii subsp. arupensis OK-94-513]EJF97501.1 hypothetical protein MEI_01195 [Bartonella vinsonii subsp. arupensis Pm136co]
MAVEKIQQIHLAQNAVFSFVLTDEFIVRWYIAYVL